MKKLLLSIALALLTFTLSAQKSNYEKYWQAREDSITKTQTTLSKGATEKQVTSAKPEYDDLYYQPSKDVQKVKKHKRVNTEDTLRAVIDTLVKENPDIQVNYVYNDDPFYYSNMIGRYYHGGFNYWMYSDPWYYSNWMYDPYDWYWDMRFSGYPYWNYGFGFGYNNWGWNFGWNWYHPYYHNNYWNHNNWYTHHDNWNNGGRYNGNHEYVHIRQESSLSNRRVVPVQPQNKAMYQTSRRTYSPSYNNPRMPTRPQYNNSRVENNVSNRRTQISTFNRSTQSRTYSPPARSYNSTPSRSYSQSSSRSYNSSSNFSSGRSSGSSNFSSGGRSSSSSSGRR